MKRRKKHLYLVVCYFFFYNKKKSSVNFDAIIIYSFRFENDFSASGKPTLTWCVEIRNIVPYLQLFFFFQNYIFLLCFFVKMQNNTEENYYFFPLHQTHNYTYILWAYDKQCFYCIVNEILLFSFLYNMSNVT